MVGAWLVQDNLGNPAAGHLAGNIRIRAHFQSDGVHAVVSLELRRGSVDVKATAQRNASW